MVKNTPKNIQAGRKKWCACKKKRVYIKPKRPLEHGEAIKSFEALVLVINMTENALLACQVTYGGRLLLLKPRLCLLSMAKMAKLVFFGPTLHHNQEDP